MRRQIASFLLLISIPTLNQGKEADVGGGEDNRLFYKFLAFSLEVSEGWQTKGIILQAALSHTFQNQASAAIDLLTELVAADSFVVSRLKDDRRFSPLKDELAFRRLVVAAQTENNGQRDNATGT